MISSFDIPKLKDMLKDLYNVTGLRITVFDNNYIEILSYPDPLPDFCRLVRTKAEGARRCYGSDKCGCEMADTQSGVHIYRCHAGLTEVITAMKLGKINIGYLCFGHISPLDDQEEAWKLVSEKISDLGLPMKKMENAFRPREHLSDTYLESAANLLLAVSSYVCVTHLATLKKDDLPFQLDLYINENLGENIDSQVLCDKFKISRAKLYQVSMSNFGMGIMEYIRSQRVKKAQDLLLHTNDSINKIACEVGIQDYNYFTKVFKREVGMTPSKYRSTLTK